MPLAAGTRLDSFEIVAPLGAGGMGEVYRARDVALKRDVAIKVLPEYWTRDPERLHRFELEAQAAAALNHPNIVSIYHVGQYNGSPYIVTELLHGETLRERLHGGPMRLREAIDVGVDIARGLAAAHDAGITHRDLKPENIFLTKDGRVKILDFGLAKLQPSKGDSADGPTASYQGQTSPGHVLGTVGYMSPEQVRGQSADARSDIFAAGAVLYEMLTGKPAFRKATSAETMTAILNEDPPAVSQLAPNLPPGLQRIVSRCLAKNPAQRIQHATDLEFALEALSDTSSRTLSSVEQSPSGTRRMWIAAALAAIGIAAGLYIYKRLLTPAPRNPDLQNMSMERITDRGKVGKISISPDGRYIAYSLREPQQSLWVEQVASRSEVQIVPPAPESILGVTFSPDGNYVYFARGSAIYVVPTLGGTPRMVINDHPFGGVGVSPDGTKLAYANGGGSEDRSQLIVVNTNGTGRRVIAQHPRWSGTIFTTPAAPSWSPDGTSIAMPASSRTGDVLNIYSMDGSHKVLSVPGLIAQGLWLPDATGLLLAVSASAQSATFGEQEQIWLQPYPKGSLQRLTNDLTGYKSLSITSDGKLLAAVQAQNSYTIFVAPASKLEDGKAIGSGRSEGVGLMWMPDGTLLSQSVDSEFSSLTPDGKQRVALFKNQVLQGEYSICRNGHIVFRRSVPGSSTIWYAEDMRQNPKQLTEGPNDYNPNCSPDGRSVIFASANPSAIRRVSVKGGAPVTLCESAKEMGSPRYSPDGLEIADLEDDGKTAWYVIRSAETGQLKKTFDLPPGFDPADNSASWGLRWTPDGKALTYPLWKGPGTPTNLWRQSLSGGPPRQITNFPDQIVAYDWSADGKQLVFTRWTALRDVVLIRNFH